MRGLFKDNLPLAELVLRIITGKQDLVLLQCEIQAEMTAVNLRKLGLTSEQIARAVGFRVEKVET